MKKVYLLIVLSVLISCRNSKQTPLTYTNEKIEVDSIKLDEDARDIYSAFYSVFDRLCKIEGSENDTISNTSCRKINSNKGLNIDEISFYGYLELNDPQRFFYPFKDSISNKIEFIVAAYDYSGEEYPLNISFRNSSTFTLGKNYILLTPKLEASGELDHFDDKSFLNPNMIAGSDYSFFLKYGNKKYLLFLFSDGPWWIHHLFDISDPKDIKYYILYSIYTVEDGYFVGKDGSLKFKQKYFYLQNSEDTSKDKYRIIDIP